MSSGLHRFLVRVALLKASQVVAVSSFSRNILNQNGVVRAVHVIPNGVNIGAHSHRMPNTSKLVLITVGSVTDRKGQHNVVAALPLLVEKFGIVEYHVVGIESRRENLECIAHDLGVSENVTFHGVVAEEIKKKLIRQSDIFMMLSENRPDGDVEGFGIAVLEANDLGVPAVGARGTGVEQSIQNGVSGFVVDAKDPEEITNCISIILSDYEKFSRGARQWAQQHDWDSIGDRYEAILTSEK